MCVAHLFKIAQKINYWILIQICIDQISGDLRAQLSKKRAEKLHKIPAEQVSSRLLKYALKGAVFKKQKKKSKDKDITSNGKSIIN